MLRRERALLRLAVVVLWIGGSSRLIAAVTDCRGSDLTRDCAFNGIEVDDPKIYDDAFLTQMLQLESAQLAQLNAFDNPSLISRIGGLQGAQSRQSSFAAQGSVSSRAATKATPLTPGTPAITDTGAAALPSSLTTSAGDALAEQARLAADIADLRLLLTESYSDLYTKTSPGLPKRTLTVGIPISIEAPPGAAGAVAEVELSLEAVQDGSRSPERPGVVALLPREESYNVAAIKDSSTSLGAGAVISNVVNVGASWFGRTQSAYIVQALDTVALQRPTTLPATTVLAWQFRPVLGQKAVKAGMREVFARLSFDMNGTSMSPATISIRTSWRRYDAATGIVGRPISGPNLILERSIQLKDIEAKEVGAITWADLGNGQVTVFDQGPFAPRTTVLVPEGPIGDGSPGFSLASKRMIFNLEAAQLVRPQVGWVLSAAGDKAELLRQDCAPNTDPPSKTTIGEAEAMPFDAVQSKVTVSLTGDCVGADSPPLILLGQAVYGLSNAPLHEDEVTTCGLHGELKDWQKVSFLAPTADVRQYRRLSIAHLFCGARFYATHQIEFKTDFVATSATTLSASSETTVIGISGDQLSNDVAVLVNGVPATPGKVPRPKMAAAPQASTPLAKQKSKPCVGDAIVDDTYRPTLLLVAIPTCQLAGVKSLVLARTDGPAVQLALAAAPGDPKPQITAPAPLPQLAAGTKRVLVLTGTNLGLLKDVLLNGTTLQPRISPDQSSISVPLPDAINTVVGLHLLTAVQNDKDQTQIPVVVQIIAPPSSATAAATVSAVGTATTAAGGMTSSGGAAAAASAAPAAPPAPPS